MNFRSLHKFILALAAPLLLGACSDSNDDIPSPIEEDFEGIMINVPTRAASSLTRGDLETGEGKVNNLTVIAYKVKDAAGNEVTTTTPSVKSVSTIPSLSADKYEQVPMPLAAGTYHIYVVANVTPEVWSNNTKADWDKLTEKELQALEINTAPSFDPEYLPMTCNYLAIRKTPSTANTWGTCFEKGEVKIDSKKTTKIYADLTFAVAKVRYSIVNGKLPFLKMATDENSRVKFLNYAKTSSLMTHKEEISEDDLSTEDEGAVGQSGTYYEWTIKDYDNAKGPDDEDAFAAGMKELADPANASTWCFRGTAYVPERLFAEVNEKVREITTDNPTMIKFNFNNEDYSDKAKMEFGGEVVIPSSQTGTTNHTHKGIIRGVVYEVKAFTTEKEITLKVRVRPWAYEKYTWEL